MRRQQYAEANIRPTASETLFYIESASPLLDWLVREKQMERATPEELGRHYALLMGEGMDLTLDSGAMGTWVIRCLGRNKKELSDWVREFSRLYEGDS